MNNRAFDSAKRIESLTIYLQDGASGMDFSLAFCAHKKRMNNGQCWSVMPTARASGERVGVEPTTAHQGASPSD